MLSGFELYPRWVLLIDVAFLISLTHKNFFISPPHSCLFLVLWFVLFRYLMALTFAGNACLMKVSVCICIGFVLDFTGCAKFHVALFSPSCCLYCVFKQSTAHVSFWVRFAVLWVDWSIKGHNVDFLFLKKRVWFYCEPLSVACQGSPLGFLL